MRLSIAMMLGSATCKMMPGDMNSCALGAALNAEGIPQGSDSDFRYTKVKEFWPWTACSSRVHMGGSIYGITSFASQIWEKFDNWVCGGHITYEQLCDWVRSVEPDCDCNRFNCTCATKKIEAQQEVTVGS